MRRDYAGAPLRRADLAATWLEQLERWIDEAVQAELPEPNAMVLATADVDGIPSVRTVLLKGLDEHGLTFFTNLRSRKGQELAANARAAVVFPWIALHRQVIVDGAVEALDAVGLRRVLRARARAGRRWRAAASDQSQPVESRDDLEAAYQAVEDAPPGRGAAPRALGRPAPAPGRGRVLAGTPGPPARPAPLPPHGGRVDRGAAGPLRRPSGRRPPARGPSSPLRMASSSRSPLPGGVVASCVLPPGGAVLSFSVSRSSVIRGGLPPAQPPNRPSAALRRALFQLPKASNTSGSGGSSGSMAVSCW